jgi:hypothetical protein
VWGLDVVGCVRARADASGVTYVHSSLDGSSTSVTALRPDGSVLWSSPTDGWGASPYTWPALGANGAVYVAGWDGGTHKVFGFDRATGVRILELGPYSLATGLFAYAGGLVIVNGTQVEYHRYDGSLENAYDTGHRATFVPVGDHQGNVFVAGYVSGASCPSGDITLTKLTPSGPAWSYTLPASELCGFAGLAATPDGGAIVMRARENVDQTEVTSLDTSGQQRWTRLLPAPYQSVAVDSTGVVALTSGYYPYPCDGRTCRGTHVDFVRQDAPEPRCTVGMAGEGGS